jgi:hypothetical protein
MFFLTSAALTPRTGYAEAKDLKIMTKIRARCPGCGDVEFGIERIVVIGTGSAASAYRFACPSCEEHVSRTAVPDVIELLLSAGVKREQFEHPSISQSGPTAVPVKPLTEHDVSSFRDLLSSPDWFESLQASLDQKE